jgi:hypothetical protein
MRVGRSILDGIPYLFDHNFIEVCVVIIFDLANV